MTDVPTITVEGLAKVQKNKSRRILRTAIEKGHIVRPETCSKCGKPSKRRDGRSGIQGHHHAGYDHPLDVEWLCVNCHLEMDGRVSGERHGRAVLNWEAVRHIRSSPASPKYLARLHGVATNTVCDVRRRHTWKEAIISTGADK